MKQKILKFPEGFLWGAATAAYQVEGGIAGNDWAVQKRLATAGLAVDHYHRYADDFALAKKLYQNAHRLSLEWSRIEPEENQWNEEALDHYAKVLSLLKKQGFQTFVTLHHFTNPLWVVRQGGWNSQKIITNFAGYAAKIAQSFGDSIDFWVTINEPGVYSSLSYGAGIWPPFKKNYLAAYRVYQIMLRAHNRAYEVIHGYFPNAQVGLAQNIPDNEPADKTHSSKLAAKIANYFSLTRAFAGVKQDFIGLNHYFHNKVRFAFPRLVASLKPAGVLTDKGWEIHPESLYRVLIKLKKYKKPIYITENGIADAADTKRAKYIHDYLQEVLRAISKKVPVKGYFYWSLLDNYEWPVSSGESGFDMRFGLIEVDFVTQKRTVRKSARVYAKICRSNSV